MQTLTLVLLSIFTLGWLISKNLNEDFEARSIPKWKRDWIKALRSGKYEQGDSYLFQVRPTVGDCFCCLGVLGDICGIPKETMKLKTFVRSSMEFIDNYPKEFICDTSQIDDTEVSILSVLNDRGVSFNTIADIIQRDKISAFKRYNHIFTSTYQPETNDARAIAHLKTL